MMIKENFNAFWERAILRKIKNKIWIIDPHVSYGYGQEQVITLNMPNRCDNYKKSSQELKYDIDNRTLAKIKIEYEKNLNTGNFIGKSVPFQYTDRYPWKVGIELTTRCNFKCKHCYAKPLNSSDPSYDNIIQIIDKLFDAGVVWLWFTGGECTLRKDFLDIHKYAKEKGFIVGILTNGSLITDEMILVFKEFPPSIVKVSQYGASKETYKSITGSEDNFYSFINGINKLLNNKINVAIQSVIISENKHEINQMKEFCRNMGIQQNINTTMIPALNGDTLPLQLEVKDPDLITQRKNKLVKYFIDNLKKTEKVRKKFIANNEFFCGAGINFCFITAELQCVLCLFAREEGINTVGNNKNFYDIFMSLSHVRKKILSIPNECAGCKAITICNFCKAKRNLFKSNYSDKCQEMLEIYNSIKKQEGER